MIGEKNDQVAFRVMQDATKHEVKAAVEHAVQGAGRQGFAS